MTFLTSIILWLLYPPRFEIRPLCSIDDIEVRRLSLCTEMKCAKGYALWLKRPKSSLKQTNMQTNINSYFITPNLWHLNTVQHWWQGPRWSKKAFTLHRDELCLFISLQIAPVYITSQTRMTTNHQRPYLRVKIKLRNKLM